jgi:dTDP-4-amino-4,6-dideoxygalactose transaminase
MKFAFVRPEIPPVAEWEEFLDVPYARRYFTNFGELETRLSQELLERFGGEHASVTLAANATCGLTAALIAHGVRGKVVIPNFTFPATLDAVFSARCTPVLCDVEAETGEMRPDSLERACRREEIAAVMPVRAYGFVRDFSSIIAIARSFGATTIIDGAAALGAGRVEVANDVTEVLSLHATKSLGIGEGGVIFAHERRKAALRAALNFGLRPDRRFEFGINGKMSEFQAAIGIAQLRHVERLIEGRRAMAEWYSDTLAHSGMILPDRNASTAWSNYPVLLPRDVDAEAFQQACHAQGLQVRRYYWPTLANGFTETLSQADDLETSSTLAERAMCLPLYATSTREEREEIAEILDACLDSAGAGTPAAQACR